MTTVEQPGVRETSTVAIEVGLGTRLWRAVLMALGGAAGLGLVWTNRARGTDVWYA